jgi:hypothetical protein
VVLDTIILCKRKQQINTRQNKLLRQSSAMSVGKKNNLPTTAKPHHQLPCQSTQDHFALNVHYVLRKVVNGKVKVTFLDPPSKSRPRQIWVAKSLIEKVIGPKQNRAPKLKLDLFIHVGELQGRWEPLGN